MPNTEPETRSTGPRKTTTGRAWLIKFLIFLIAASGLGAWFLYDGLVAYPNNAREHARYTLLTYLEALERENRLRPSNATVENPAQTYEQLSSTQPSALSETERQRLAWLESLTLFAELEDLQGTTPNPELEPGDPGFLIATTFTTPTQTLETLRTYFQARPTPTALAAYDIPVQLILGFICTAAALFVLVRLTKTKLTTYTYHPEQHRLTGPGLDITPDDIQLVDKRKWDKFLVFINFNDDRPEHKLDLYRFHPLEDWVLELEKLSPNHEPEPQDGQLLLADVLTAVAANHAFPPDHKPPFTATDDHGRTTRFPVFQDTAGTWHIIGADERKQLKQLLNEGKLPPAELKADPDSFTINIERVEQPTAENAEQNTAQITEQPAADDDTQQPTQNPQ